MKLLQPVHQEVNHLRSQADRRPRVRLVEAEEFHARAVWEEERPDLEEQLIFGKGLCWRGAFSAETGDEECRKQEAVDFRVGLPRLRIDDGNGPRVATFVGFEDGGRSSGSNPCGRNANQVWNNGDDWLPCVTHWQPDACWTTAGKSHLCQKLPT